TELGVIRRLLLGPHEPQLPLQSRALRYEGMVTEAIQLGMAAELLEQASDLLAAEKVASDDLRAVARDLAGALTTTLRVAASRGQRLSQPDSADPERGDEGPRLPASAFV
ncbi:hypothetical protein ABZS88_46555, partial [Streptomyces sp. NPDC005480]|uniref:hypothetical protein n=1 Tax=Streptomyces sp. NPDC005480 TaxID=3154880 RepID=UPI0033ADAB71